MLCSYSCSNENAAIIELLEIDGSWNILHFIVFAYFYMCI